MKISTHFSWETITKVLIKLKRRLYLFRSSLPVEMWCIPFYQNYMKNKERNLKKKKKTVYTCESIPLHLNLCSAIVLAELVLLLEKLNWKNVDGKRELEKQSVRILFILWVSEYCNKSHI